MMRYGVALLASSYTNPVRHSFSEDIHRKTASFLSEKCEIPNASLKQFKAYLYKKPGSRRYTPIRRAIEKGQTAKAERQDLLLSNVGLRSSVGALTQDYFDDALSLAHTLRLVEKNQNHLLARGRLSLSTSWKAEDPFRLDDRDVLYLGLWLLDVDCDWLWAFLGQLPNDSNFEITTENRVPLLLKSWRHVLSAKQIRSGHPESIKIRTRLHELIKITERNLHEKLNLGQPWSWFLIPRLELLVDTGILQKKEKHGLTGYSLTSVGLRLRNLCDINESGEILIRNYFFCRVTENRPVAENVEWNEINKKILMLTHDLKSTVGYFPIFEAASALCVSQLMDSATSNEPIWEIESIKESLWQQAKSSSPNVTLAINRQGQIYAFKPLE